MDPLSLATAGASSPIDLTGGPTTSGGGTISPTVNFGSVFGATSNAQALPTPSSIFGATASAGGVSSSLIMAGIAGLALFAFVKKGGK